MPESIAPAFVKIEYLSAYAPHAMLIPTREWSPPAGGFAYGSFPRWSDDTARDADDMIGDLLEDLELFFSPTTTFYNWTIFTQDSPSDDPVPRVSKSVTEVGTDASDTWEKAVQSTINFRTAGFKASKIVLLDAPGLDNFDRVVDPADSVALTALVPEFTSVLNAWSGRDGTRPATFISLTRTLNEALRRRYRMA